MTVLIGVCACDIQDLDFDLKLDNLDSDVAVPLGSATYTLRELFEEISDETFDEDAETTLLSLTYTADANFVYGGGPLNNGDTLDISDAVIDIDFFNTLDIQGIRFGNPIITHQVDNDLPFDFAMDFSRVNGEDSLGALTFMRGRVVRTPPEVEAQSSAVVEITSDNSNINDIMGQSPSRLNLDLGAIINEPDTNVLNNVAIGTEVNTSINMFFPMEVLMKEVKKDFDFDIDDGVQFDEADSVSLRIVTDNELPFAASMDLYILTGTDTLYQALENQPLVTPFINNGEVVEARRGIADVPLNPTGVAALNNGDRIVIIVSLTTPQSQTSEDLYVKVLARYALQISLGLRGVLDVKI